MNAPLYIDILEWTLLPFIREAYPDGHRFMQDNDPKRTPRAAAAFMEAEGIRWWKTPAESPDCNPIENLWHELKEFLRREVKPKNKEEMVEGIRCFWDAVDVKKCQKYIRHLRKVIAKVIELKEKQKVINVVICYATVLYMIVHVLCS